MGVEGLDQPEGHAKHVTLPHLLIRRPAAYLEFSSKNSSRESMILIMILAVPSGKRVESLKV